MKILFSVLVAAIACTNVLAQDLTGAWEANFGSRLILKKTRLIPGKENVFVYHPISKLSLPGKVAASILYQTNGQFHNKIIQAKKSGDKYQFSFKVPAATSVLIIGMVDNRQNLANFSPFFAIKKTVIDNNEGNGFIFYQGDKTNKQLGQSKIILADLLENNAEYFLDIKAAITYLLQLYQEAYRLNPGLKSENSYVNYLSVLYDLKKDSAKSVLLTYANQIQNSTKDEIKWRQAARIYSWLKMNDEAEKTKKKILSEFPNGELAKEQYWNDYYNSKELTEKSVLNLMADYKKRFNDSSAPSKDKFYTQLVSLSISDKNWKALFHYERLISDKFAMCYTYNKMANILCGEELDRAGTDLGTAKMLSKKAVDFAKVRLKNAEYNNEALEEAQGEYNRYLNTYALILYKLGQFDSAFFYQDIIYRQKNALNTTGVEHYAAYAEKAKGIKYAKGIVEDQLMKGITSAVLLKQLASIYKQLNISLDDFARMQQRSDLLFWQKNEAWIKAKYGKLKANDFSLINMSDESVSLSSLGNKVVMIDFWANWCSPCKASFPMMQKLVEKYKHDTDIVFLFIDVWETASAQLNLEKTKQFISENKYGFDVLFDVKNKVVADYKIKGIPTKFVINKKGEIIFVDESLTVMSDEEIIKNLSFYIEAAKK